MGSHYTFGKNVLNECWGEWEVGLNQMYRLRMLIRTLTLCK